MGTEKAKELARSNSLEDKKESSDLQMKGRGSHKRRGSFSQGRGAKRGRGSSRGGRGCYNCNQDGHKAKDCPDGGGRSCFNCKQDGHIKKDCPEPDRRNQPKTENS